MADNKMLEVQLQARQSALQVQDALCDVKKFEEEMKIKEQKMRENFAANLKQDEKQAPVRSNIDEFSAYTEDSIKRMKKLNVCIEDETAAETRQRAADQYKEEGTELFRLKNYKGAIEKYTAAIETFPSNPIYFSNRSQCHINLGDYLAAVEDADKALELDNKSEKSFYRRTLAYEKLGEDIKALASSQEWMIALPNDQRAKNTYDSIHNRIIERNRQKEKEKIKWSRMSAKTSFMEKASHLRSRSPLKKIPIRVRKSHSPIPDDIIDKLFNNNTGEHVAETVSTTSTDSKLFKSNFLEKSYSKSSSSASTSTAVAVPEKQSNANAVPKEKTKVNETNEMLKAGSTSNDCTTTTTESEKIPDLETLTKRCRKLTMPTTGPEFCQTWKELSEELKFMYLKNISETPALKLGKLIGSQIDSTLLSEIIEIVHKYFLMHYKLPYVSLLDELSENPELETLKLFLDSGDKSKLNDMVNATSQSNNNHDGCGDNENNSMIQKIKHAFQL